VKPNITTENLNKVIKTSIWIIGIAATLIALNVTSVYSLWVLCSDFVYCLLFPQLVTALFDKKANKIGSMAGFAVGVILRFGGGEATLGLPILIDYPMIEDGVVLFPFRTLAMLSSLLTIIFVSRLTQKWDTAKILVKGEE
jgi:high affinity choline transporter 7